MDYKCSWRIKIAFEFCTPEQHHILDIKAGTGGADDNEKAESGEEASGMCEKPAKEV